MISKDTAANIMRAYYEIEAGEKMIETLANAVEKRNDIDLHDFFGRRRYALQLGVPNCNSSQTCYDVDPVLGLVVLRAHVAKKRAELEALSVLASTELATKSRLPPAGEGQGGGVP